MGTALCVILAILAILAILFIFKVCNNVNIDTRNYNLYTKMGDYRIGDIFLYNHADWTNSIIKEHLEKYPDSLASAFILKNEYNSKHTIKNNYIKILFEILQERYKNKVSDICVCHLRVGDILDDPFYRVKNGAFILKDDIFPTKQQIPKEEYFNNLKEYVHDGIKVNNVYEKYMKPLSFYEEKIEKMEELNINKVIIMAGSHKKLKEYTLSSYYINTIKKLFNDNGIKVVLRLAQHPDNDIQLVYNSKYFIEGNGGYSKLLKQVVVKKGNTVI